MPIRWVLVRDPLGRFDPQALLCTDPNQDPLQVLRWFVQRWQLETTFQETRAHLGVETQRQWSDLAIARTTPCLLGLFSLVTLLAAQLSPTARGAVMSAAWYHNATPPSATHSPLCGDISGRNRVLPCRAIQARRRNTAQRSRTALLMRSATLPNGQSRA